MTKIGIDVGYGFTKAVSSSGIRVSFPSVVAPAVADPLSGLFRDGVGHRVKVSFLSGTEEKLVGESALQSQSAQTFVAQAEKPEKMHDLLLLTAAYLCGAGVKTNEERPSLAVGLPLSYYRMQKDILKERLANLAAWVSVDGGEEKYIAFKKVVVYPQGAGALVATGNALPKTGTIGLVDIGEYTSDFLLFNVKSGMPVPIPEACGSAEAGVHLIRRAIANEFEKQTGVPLPERMYQFVMDRLLAGEEITYRGREVKLSAAFARAKQDVAETIASHILAAWGDRTGFLSLTVLAGGGALLFGDVLAGYFPQAVQAPDPVFANATGYFMMLND